MMQFWNSPELYASIGAVIGTTAVVIYLTAPGRLKAKERKLQEQPPKTRGQRGPLGELLLLDSSRGNRTVAPAERDAHAGYFALKGTEHQLSVNQKVKPDPIYIGKHLVEQGAHIGSIRQAIALGRKKPLQLKADLAVSVLLGKARIRFYDVHVSIRLRADRRVALCR